jgi:hypothetical protein
VHKKIGSVAADGEVILYQANGSTVDGVTGDDFPATFAYLFFWSDQNVQLQLITDTPDANVVFPILANTPFILSNGGMLAVATDTRIVADATVSPIDMVHLHNLAASATANYVMVLVL